MGKTSLVLRQVCTNVCVCAIISVVYVCVGVCVLCVYICVCVCLG